MCAQQIQEIPKLARNSLTSKSVKIVGTYPEKRCYETNWQQQVGGEGWGADLGKNYNSKRKIGNYLPSTC